MAIAQRTTTRTIPRWNTGTLLRNEADWRAALIREAAWRPAELALLALTKRLADLDPVLAAEIHDLASEAVCCAVMGADGAGEALRHIDATPVHADPENREKLKAEDKLRQVAELAEALGQFDAETRRQITDTQEAARVQEKHHALLSAILDAKDKATAPATSREHGA